MDSKSNETTAIPALLDQLMVKNSIVTLDAMGCQTAIAQKTLDRGADYLLAAKRTGRWPIISTKPALIEAHRRAGLLLMNSMTVMVASSVARVFVSNEAAGLEALRCWPGLRAVLAVETIRSINGSAKPVAEMRFFLTSGPDAPEVLARAIRKH